ncbi:hypothetical protein MOB44_19685 [Bacillus sonorensis]|uniref:hypothetical protein n=1 Tax=Bacillus sonorensis TaxID=119858 RepID=UPI001F303CE9|nr:hypothetical protein [Bacillus sonorensis]MCF7618622.1 hypothetical protein [Bacillus sonorensis]MCY7858848.1 hypothetical protein [Bacillus sonorensis]
MGYSKDFAINVANKRADELDCKHYAIHNPKTYREIFDNTGFTVKQKVSEGEKISVVYETK